MFLDSVSLLSTVRNIIVDYEYGARIGRAWSDDQILSIFTTYYNEFLQELAHKGITFAIAQHIDYIVYGPNTLGTVVGGGVTPVSLLLPPECIYVCSVGWDGLNVPIYHISEDEPTIDSFLEGTKEPVALFLSSGPQLRLTVDFSSPVALPEHIVVAYLRRLPAGWWVSSTTYQYPSSRLVYWVALGRTLIHLLEPDTGSLKVAYSPAFAPLEQIGMIGNKIPILLANGRLKFLRPMEAR